jgi:hypothetical protein
MKGGTRTALALGLGYVLGRRRKMRLTTMIAAGVVTGGIGGLGGAALRRGLKMAGSTEALSKVAPQLGELADTVRDDLLDTGKAAVAAAATRRIGSLSDSLHDRAQNIREPAGALTEQATGRITRRRGQDASGEYAETARGEALQGDEYDAPEADQAGSSRSAAPARRRRPGRAAGSAVTRPRTPAAPRARR